MTPSGKSERTMASWPAEPVEEEPPVGLHRLDADFGNTEEYQMAEFADLIQYDGPPRAPPSVGPSRAGVTNQ